MLSKSPERNTASTGGISYDRVKENGNLPFPYLRLENVSVGGKVTSPRVPVNHEPSGDKTSRRSITYLAPTLPGENEEYFSRRQSIRIASLNTPLIIRVCTRECPDEGEKRIMKERAWWAAWNPVIFVSTVIYICNIEDRNISNNPKVMASAGDVCRNILLIANLISLSSLSVIAKERKIEGVNSNEGTRKIPRARELRIPGWSERIIINSPFDG